MHAAGAHLAAEHSFLRERHFLLRHDLAFAIAFGVRTAGGRFVFPPDIEERLDDRERRIHARIERLRTMTDAESAAALASVADPDTAEPSHA